MEEYLYTVEEVAVILNVNKNVVYDLIKKGRLDVLKFGRFKITKSTLLNYLKDYKDKNLSDIPQV
ncbi:helix-turn-helix domain-containing protein [Clostridium sporogenes]|uniref:helix-turn-helix domain-containing protein n=1 Tax=Clostridium sporogenes TaxID=1509 RepID=UPI0006D0F4B0|nr:helix-turn-helix domain-containing protein [Clostridium sporogenes]EJP6471733.1 helix-turn-helix domain-containing protein [Clostridium botulinum]NFN85987.1 helix-turn-helix domain-containing protein [Clostridium sporogenes]NFS24847.1 helix-turn-helix domain-containing protein [Clostridium sporogenes]NFV11674.1 helix-turn-helix domain-containing protein [Clostridium sporogenes]